jgi:tRNA(adenine34) deaminase
MSRLDIKHERNDAYWMGKALREAEKAAARDEVPIGAVIVRDGVIIGRGFNLREGKRDPSAHAEMIAIRQAARRSGNWRLTGATLYVTLEPCLMCMGAIILARLERVVFGCYDPKGGAAGSLYDLSADQRLNHQVTLMPGVCQDLCAAMLSDFFRSLRSRKKAKDDPKFEGLLSMEKMKFPPEP